MSDFTIEFNADRSISCVETGLRCTPPGRVEYISSGDGTVVWALFMAGQRVTPELLADLIDTYEFFAKAMPEVPLVIGTGG